jgi:hypothetical protein
VRLFGSLLWFFNVHTAHGSTLFPTGKPSTTGCKLLRARPHVR